MFQIIKASNSDLEKFLSIRKEMLKDVNDSENYDFDEVFIKETSDYFLTGNQTTVFAIDNEKVVGCATICYINILPTFSHAKGARAHLMNVYTNEQYRRQGIGLRMVEELIKQAKNKGVTYISLDTTAMGEKLYEKLGFIKSGEAMGLNLNEK